MRSNPQPTKTTPIHIWHPQIQDTPITSKTQLHHILNQEYPGLRRNPDYPQLLKDAEHHLELTQLLKDRTHLERGERTTLAKQIGITRQKLTAWAQQARPPRLYYQIERSISKTQARTKLTQIHQENNGITSTEYVKQRLKTYYHEEELATSKHHQKRLTQCTQYFEALTLLQEGGCYLDIARQLNTRHSQIQRWLQGRRPDLIELARRIPPEPPKTHHKWLPRRMEGNFHPTDFITVPENIHNWHQIRSVLEQIQPFINKHMTHWQKQFGDTTQEDAFSHLLGILVSDASKYQFGYTSTYIELRLTKKYPWSRRLGEATCYYLGKLGIGTQKGRDRDSTTAGPKTLYSWKSENSPLITWILRSCLGLKSHQRTTYDPIQAAWILLAPVQIRKSFLQGLNDGDGWASIKDQCIGNACKPNIPFVKQLLQTFSIKSTDDGQRVRIRRQKSIIRAAELPFFRHAIERQANADKIAVMMHTRMTLNPEFIPEEVIQNTQRLRKQGKSYGEIAEIIFDTYSVSYDLRRIAYILRKYGPR